MRIPKPRPAAYKTEVVPAPVQGLNVYDAIVAMADTYAIEMRNWWPQPYGCSVRKGYVEWATGMPATVQTLATWYGTAGTSKMFAWSGTAMYDVSTRGAVGAAVLSGLTNALWESVCFSNTAGSRMVAVNGVDNAITYTSSGGVQRIVAGDGITANTWAGVAPTSAAHVCVHQRRLWIVKKDTTEGWYLPPDSYQGTFVKFDFGPQMSRGGFLQFLTTWTLDDGHGATDHLIAVTSEGEAIVYSGTDPSSSSTWSLVGVYYVGAPVSGRRAYAKAGGDQLFLTQRGLISMSEELTSTRVNQAQLPLTSLKIQFLISDLIGQFSTLSGWQVVYCAAINMVLISVPSVTSGGNIQLAANQITNAWTEFSDMDSACWSVFHDELYFGDYTGRVYKAWTGYSDKVLLDNTGGVGVTTSVQQAYSYFDNRATQKQVALLRPTFLTTNQLAYSLATVYDFEDIDAGYPRMTTPTSESLWGTGTWGAAIWGGGTKVNQEWVSGYGVGSAVSLKMTTLSDSEVLWVATNYAVVNSRGIL